MNLKITCTLSPDLVKMVKNTIPELLKQQEDDFKHYIEVRTALTIKNFEKYSKTVQVLRDSPMEKKRGKWEDCRDNLLGKKDLNQEATIEDLNKKSRLAMVLWRYLQKYLRFGQKLELN